MAATTTSARAQASVETSQESRTRSGAVVALAQLAPRLGDLETNLDRHLAAIEDARQKGANLVVFPELSLTGYFLKDLVPDVALTERSPQLAAIAAACKDVDAVVGCVYETDDARFYNAALYFSGGRLAHVHRKVYLPTYGLFDEARYFSQGDEFRNFVLPMASANPRHPWTAGILICEDLWHPTSVALLARQGMDVLICVSSSPGRGVGADGELGTASSYDVMTRTFGQLYTTYVVYCNRVGFEDGVNFWGGSRVVDPQGALVADPAGRKEELILARLDLDAIRRARIANPLLRDERHDVNDAQTDRIRRSARD